MNQLYHQRFSTCSSSATLVSSNRTISVLIEQYLDIKFEAIFIEVLRNFLKMIGTLWEDIKWGGKFALSWLDLVHHTYVGIARGVCGGSGYLSFSSLTLMSPPYNNDWENISRVAWISTFFYSQINCRNHTLHVYGIRFLKESEEDIRLLLYRWYQEAFGQMY